MRFKIDPEAIRLIQAIAAGLQAVIAVLTGIDAVPPVVLVVVVVAGTFLQATTAAYQQGVQTEPPHGMITEEYARNDYVSNPSHTDTAVIMPGQQKGREPEPEWIPDTRPSASG